MTNIKMKKSIKEGLPPGSIVFTGNQKVDKVTIHHIQYDESQLNVQSFTNRDKTIFHQSEEKVVDWYDIRGLHDTALIKTLGDVLQINTLALEDVAEVGQRPKFEEFERGIFIVAQALHCDLDPVKIEAEQVSIYFREGLILTFQETASDLFEGVRNRIINASGKIRTRGSDYLAYAIIDDITDHYFPISTQLDEVIQTLEDNLFENSDSLAKTEIHELRKQCNFVRSVIIPLREAMNRFSRSERNEINPATKVFIRDLIDHIVQINEQFDDHRETLSSLQDYQFAEVGYRTNQIVQLLTIITTIFVPLTFLAGIYGMNFEHIPELKYKYGYFILLGIMVLTSITLILLFKRKKWL